MRERDEKGFVILCRLLLHEYLKGVEPRSTLKEITDLVLSNTRYRTKVANGVLEVTTAGKDEEWAKGRR